MSEAGEQAALAVWVAEGNTLRTPFGKWVDVVLGGQRRVPLASDMPEVVFFLSSVEGTGASIVADGAVDEDGEGNDCGQGDGGRENHGFSFQIVGKCHLRRRWKGWRLAPPASECPGVCLRCAAQCAQSSDKCFATTAMISAMIVRILGADIFFSVKRKLKNSGCRRLAPPASEYPVAVWAFTPSFDDNDDFDEAFHDLRYHDGLL